MTYSILGQLIEHSLQKHFSLRRFQKLDVLLLQLGTTFVECYLDGLLLFLQSCNFANQFPIG